MVMISMGNKFLIHFVKGGCIECTIFFISDGNKIIFTHIIVYYMRT